MALPDDIQQKLTDENIVEGSTGWGFSINGFRPSQDRQVKLDMVPGGKSDHHGSTDEIPFQIMTRAERGAGKTAFDKIIEVFKSLHKFSGTLNGVEYGGIFTDVTPAFLMKDDKERQLFVATFRALREGPR